MKRIQLAVRDFALPVPRKGSIEVNSGYGYLPQSGDEAHTRIQQQRSDANPKYKTEIKISHSFEHGGFVFAVSGRIDGLIDGDTPHIEEIKTAFDARQLYEKLSNDADHPYCLQLKTYAYMYSLQNGHVPSASLYIASYADSADMAPPAPAAVVGKKKRSSSASHENSSSAFELPILLDTTVYEKWLQHRLDELVLEAQQRERDKQRRKAAGKALRFPFAQPRPGQLDLVDTIDRAFLAGEMLLLQAPTGLGKTAGVIFPALRDTLRRGQKLIYVTPKNSQHQVAEDGVRRLRTAAGTERAATAEEALENIRYLTLTAKSKLCFKGEPVCNPEHCEYARDYYEKVALHKLVDKVAEAPEMNGELFTRLGEEYEVCPFELSVDSIHRADVIIGDYNYVFAPVGLLGRFTGYTFGENEKPNLVIDEAHNLPARSCDYFSPQISTQDIDACRERIEALPLDMRMEAASILQAAVGVITKHQPKGREKQCKVQPKPEPFEYINQRLGILLTQYLKVVDLPKPGDPIVTLCRQWSGFTEFIEQTADNFFCTYAVDTYGITMKITCCDASAHLASCLKEFEHVVAFSATLKPFEYYQKLGGFIAEKTQTVEFGSPFPPVNRKLLVIPQVSTRYSDRARNYEKIAQAIMRICELRRGNYFVFFPSFAFLREVFDRTQLPEFNVLQQRPSMAAADVQKFIDSLRNQDSPTVIFAVQGGVFAEGIDYPGDSLIGALIVGPALPGYDLERELMREYYDRKFGNGFDYAYTYPAMARVVQAAGRVIRSEEDRGLIVLMDRRFTTPAYTATMPGDWYQSSIVELVSSSILKDIRTFWDSGAGS
ncbi:MAG TPA: ATP-dependent DNA helicase [Candidatus Obscuribacterales bacterium]